MAGRIRKACIDCKDWLLLKGKGIRHYTMLGKKNRFRKTKPNAEFYEKRGR